MNKSMFLITFVAALFLLLLAGGYTLLRGGNNPPSVGSPAPDFTLSSQDRQPVKLSAFRGQWVVLYFYPKEVSKSYDSIINLGIAKLSSRHTFLIDPQGVIRKIWLDVDVTKHSTDVLATLDDLEKK